MAFSSSERFLVERHVRNRIEWLIRLRDRNPSAYKAMLAHLRSAVSQAPGAVPDVWDVEYSGLPDCLCGKGSEPPTAGEWAVHLSFALYAVHQQSQAETMYREGEAGRGAAGIGNAVGRLVQTLSSSGRGEQLEQGEMPRRFAAFVMAESVEELAHYLRQIVHQLRSEGIPVDYARLAGQLYDWQLPYLRDRVRLEWGREFAASSMRRNDSEQDTPEKTSA